tara:strand:- start:695 stop:967 length:273 start_codon:yes stop_codon:yes gene_type:complete
LFTIDSPEELDAPMEFLYYLYILSNAGGKILPPPARLIVSSAEAGAWFGKTLGTYSAELNAQGIYNPVTELYTPAIMAYENSALGSSRII